METAEEDGPHGAPIDTSKNSVCEEAPEPQPPVKIDGEAAKGKRTSAKHSPHVCLTSTRPFLLSPPPPNSYPQRQRRASLH